MLKSGTEYKKRKILIILSILFVMVGLFLIGQVVKETLSSNDKSLASLDNEVLKQELDYSDRLLLPESQPTRLVIPKINVDTTFVTLGIQDNKEIEIPDTPTEVGWYQYGPTPGELGPSIVLGHVDSKDGPGVFFYLGQLEKGDIIEIERGDGKLAKFRVDSLERYEQSNFPTSLVYGDIDHAGLRLITCSGSYDSEQKRYDRNLVVYASLVDSE